MFGLIIQWVKFNVKHFISSISERLFTKSITIPGHMYFILQMSISFTSVFISAFHPSPSTQTFESDVNRLIKVCKDFQQQIDALEKSVKPPERVHSRKITKVNRGFKLMNKQTIQRIRLHIGITRTMLSHPTRLAEQNLVNVRHYLISIQMLWPSFSSIPWPIYTN